MEVLSVLNVIDFSDELLFKSLRGAEAIVGFWDQAFEVVIGLLDLVDVDFLQVGHLSEPLKHNSLLILGKIPQLQKEELFPHDVRLSKNSIY